MPSSPDGVHLFQRVDVPDLLLADMLEILASCNGVSVLLTPKRRVPDLTSGRFLTTGSSLSLAEISTAGFLVATGPLNGVLELPAPLLKYF
jgi:hypothetical protein